MKRKAGMTVWVMLVSLLIALAGCGSGGGGTSTGGGGTDTTAPSAPTALVSAAASSSSISLNWTASTDDVGVTGYKIYRGGTQISTSATNSFSDSGLTASTNYSYTVAAYDAAGNTSTQSTSASATTLAAGVTDTTAPTIPANLTATAASTSQINLSWTASTDDVSVAGYEVWRGTTKVATVTTVSYNDTGLTASTAYTYDVKDFDGAGNVSAASIAATATTLSASITDTTAPTVPAGLAVTVASASQLDLAWSASTDAVGVTGYKVYRGGTYLKSDTGTSSSDAGLTASTQYCYQISAYDTAENESNKSAEVCATTATAAVVVPGANFKMPDTGQTTSYTTTFGEDHDYTINPPSYTDNGNGTITDNVTGLVWQKQDDGVTKTWADAVTYCDNLSLGSQTDWRLPSRIELVSIVDYGVYNPAINATFFQNTASSADYWSSTALAHNYLGAWYVEFYRGNPLNGYDKTDSHYVRCVRGGQ